MMKQLLIIGVLILFFLLTLISGWFFNDTTSNKEKVVKNITKRLKDNLTDFAEIINDLNEFRELYPEEKFLIYRPQKFNRLELSIIDSSYGIFPDTTNVDLLPSSLNYRLNKLLTNTVKFEHNSYSFICYDKPYFYGQISLVYNQGGDKVNSILFDQLTLNYSIPDSFNWLYKIDSNWYIYSEKYWDK